MVANPWQEDYEPQELVEVACPVCGATDSREVASEFGIQIARCARCDLVYTRTRRKHSQDHYGVSRERFLEKYGPILRDQVPHPRDRNYREHLALLERTTQGRDLLDVGAHAGFFLRRARERGWRVVGVEPSPTTSGLARELLALDVRTGTLDDVELPPESFDVVTMTDVLEHVEHPLEVLRRIHSLLRPSGRVFVKVPNVRYVLAKHRTLGRVPTLLDDVFDAREHVVFYSDTTLANVLELAEFEVESMRVPLPIQTGNALQRALRASGTWVARRAPRGAALPLSTDITALARRP